MTSDHDIYQLTEADRASQTRFGTRPVPPGHISDMDHHFRKRASSDGAGPRAGRDEPSLTGRIVVWGGIALGVAGVTAAAVIAARKLGDAMSDDQPERGRRSRDYRPQQNHVAPRFAALDEDEREAMRRRVRARARADEDQDARLRASASRRRRKPRKDFAREVNETTSSLSSGLDGVTASLTGAFQGFRSVAGQASGIVREFSDAADQLRSMLRGFQENGSGKEAEDRYAASKARDQRRSHRL